MKIKLGNWQLWPPRRTRTVKTEIIDVHGQLRRLRGTDAIMRLIGQYLDGSEDCIAHQINAEPDTKDGHWHNVKLADLEPLPDEERELWETWYALKQEPDQDMGGS